MKRKLIPYAAAAVFLMLAVALTSLPAPAASVKDLLSKIEKHYTEVKSVDFVYFTHGYDTFAGKKSQELQEKEGQGGAKKSGGPPKLVDATYNVRFMKPYVIQMTIVNGDFLPQMVWGGKFTYNPETSTKNWYAKLGGGPPMKRAVKNDEYIDMIVPMGWTMNLLHLKNHLANGTAKLAGKQKVQGRDCNVIEISYTDAQWKDFKLQKVDFKKWGIPADVETAVYKSIKDVTTKKYSSVKYFVTVKDNFIIQTEDYIGGKFFWRTEYRNVQFNNLKKSDFNPK